jgi:hypothetical protein
MKKKNSEIVPVTDRDKPITIYKTYEAMVNYFKKEIDNFRAKELVIKWELGGQVALMLSDNKVYGGKQVSNLAESLDLAETLLYGYRQLYLLYDKKTIERLIAANIGYHTLQLLNINKLPDDKRREFIELLINKKLTHKELVAKLEQYRKPVKKVKAKVKEEDVEPQLEEGEEDYDREPTEEELKLEEAELENSNLNSEIIEDEEIELVPLHKAKDLDDDLFDTGEYEEDPEEDDDEDEYENIDDDYDLKDTSNFGVFKYKLAKVNADIAKLDKRLDDVYTLIDLLDRLDDDDDGKQVEKGMILLSGLLGNLKDLNIKVNQVCMKLKPSTM